MNAVQRNQLSALKRVIFNLADEVKIAELGAESIEQAHAKHPNGPIYDAAKDFRTSITVARQALIEAMERADALTAADELASGGDPSRWTR